jgi:hypothetical protein
VCWLVALVIANLAVVYLMWPESGSEAAPVAEVQDTGSLQLIGELSPADREARARQDADSQPQIPTATAMDAPEELVCRAWGPFNDITQLEPLQASVATVGSAIEVRTSEIAGEPDFLVFIDTGGNPDTARRTLAELQNQSVDAYVIAGGPFLNAVSVGVFSRQDRARSQHERVESLGYKASIEALNRSQSVYHLIARVPVAFELADLDSIPCNAIASVQ